MSKNLNRRIRSTAARAWARAQTEALKEVSDEVSTRVAMRSPAVGDWIARMFPRMRKLVVILLLLTALAAVHFYGFVSEVPESIQRLVATSFAPEFSAIFVYYAALAFLGARFATYVVAALAVSGRSWKECQQASESQRDMRHYLRNAKKNFSILEWPIFIVAPFLLAFIYADFQETLISLVVITLTFVLLCPIAIPQAALAPKRFIKRLFGRHPSLKRLRSNINLLVLLAVALFAMSFYLGKARYAQLASECAIPIKSSAYGGMGTILAQTGEFTLVLERDSSRTHSRYILFRDNFLVSDTTPPRSELFEPLSRADQPSSSKVVSSAASFAATSVEVACRSSGGQ